MEQDDQTAPKLSVVVGCVGEARRAVACLEALRASVADAEVLVGCPESVPAELRAAFPKVAFYERSGALVPELWRDGIDAACGSVVALTISPMVPDRDWAVTALREAAKTGVIAGAIDPLHGIPLSDLAECLCRYARDMTPFEPHESPHIPGDNCAYRRDLLLQDRALWADGFWEPTVNSALAARGVPLRHDSSLRVRHGRSAGSFAFLRQRLVHGRAYGRQRGVRMGRTRNLLGIAGCPVVPWLLVARTYRELWVRRRLNPRMLATLPWLIVFNVAWALGEARGHADFISGL